ncbi:MAG: hypothetical protein LRS47_02130 [Desulfurococcales archaeon]|nr:hypothetical protein [Desulfurococcales archaeon]
MRSSRDEIVKRMVKLVQSGAVMLDSTCPLCGSPLFRLKNGDIVCPVHGKVRVVSSEDEVPRVEAEDVVRSLIDFSAKRIRDLVNSGGGTRELYEWLSILEKALNVEKELSSFRISSQTRREQRTLREREAR